MANLKITSLDEYLKQLNKIADPEPAIKAAIYEGAGLLTNEMRTAIEKLPKFSRSENGGRAHGVTDVERAGLLRGLGITPISNRDGVFNAKIGFDGYNDNKTKNWPQGKPNAMIARSIESGTSWLQSSPFVDKTTRANKKRVERQMVAAFDNEIKKIIK